MGSRWALALPPALILAGTMVAPPAQAAATYRVTEHAVCGGAGTLQDALGRANANPGRDRIEFDAGLVWLDLAPCWQPHAPFPYGLNATDSVDLIGNGVRVQGHQAFVDEAGNVNNPQKCPSNGAHGVMHWVEFSTGFMQVGTYDADNSAVAVSVSDMEFHNINSLFKVEKNASLSMADAQASNIDAFMAGCDRSVIETAYEGANVTLTRVQIDHSHAPGAMTRESDIDAVVKGGYGGNLVLDQVLFGENKRGRAVTWLGGSVKIVSSRFVNSGGMYLSTPSAQIVNSALFTSGTLPSDRVYTDQGQLDIQASTFYWAWRNATCAACTMPGMGFLAVNGRVKFVNTAVGASDTFGAGAALLVGTAGAFSSDALTWVQPTRDAVGPGAVTALLPQALTAPPGLTTSALSWLPYEPVITPLLGTPAAPGVLIDAVPAADPGQANDLKNPIDGTTITKDVFGNPRVDSNGTRDIGAVQLTLAPHLSVVGTTVSSATVAWSRPADPTSGAITGYGLFYRVKGSTSKYTRVDVAGPETTSREVSGLRPDTTYEFYVVGVNATGDGPASNTVTPTTLREAPIPAPEPVLTHLDYPLGVGLVGTPLSPLDPHVTPAGSHRYNVIAGSLPPGLALDPITGIISGTPTRAGTTTLTVQASGANGSASARVTITVHSTPQPPHLDYPLGRGRVGVAIDPLAAHTAFLTGPYAFALTSGALPPGLLLNPATGEISGTPTQFGVFQAGITAVGAGGVSTTTVARIEVASSTALLDVSLQAVSKKSKLQLTVHTTCPSQFRFRLQKRVSSRSGGGSDEPTTTVTWRTLPKTYITKGSSRTLTVNQPKGTYRALVGGACLFGDTQSPQATLKK